MKRMLDARRYAVLVHVVTVAVAVNLASLAFSMQIRAAAPMEPVRIVAFGDSLTAGYMLPAKDAFPAQLQRALASRGHAVEIVNAGVSGDTSASGLERFDWSLPEGTEAVILELGANDALRGIDPSITKRNLEVMIAKLKARNIEILLAGISSPENWGGNYADSFNAIYTDLAAGHGLILYPFFLDGVALKANLNMDDGLHPTEKGIGVIVDRILPKAEELIGRVTARRATAAKL